MLLTIHNDPIHKVDSLAGSVQVDLEALIIAWKILFSLEIVGVISIVIGHDSLCRNCEGSNLSPVVFARRGVCVARRRSGRDSGVSGSRILLRGNFQ